MRRIWNGSSRLRARFRTPGMMPRCCVDDGWLVAEVSDNLSRRRGRWATARYPADGGRGRAWRREPARRAEIRMCPGAAGGAHQGKRLGVMPRAAVREGLLGRPMTDQPASLRSRLAAAAAAHGGISGSEPKGAAGRWAYGRGRVCSQPSAVFRCACDSARPTCLWSVRDECLPTRGAPCGGCP